MRRHFEFQEGSSSKFWEIELNGTCVTTWWGRIGAGGQSKEKDFGSESKAQIEYNKLLEEKTGKGYVESGATGTAAAPQAKSATATATATAPAAVKTATAVKAAPAKPAKPVAREDDDDDDECTEERRHFEFEEGTSSKFWDIQLDECSLTTWWGKIGTAGQAKTLEFDSDEEALAAYKKLVAEKTKKGYEETDREDDDED